MPVVFFDRDGTLIISPEDRRVDSPEKVKLFPDAISALKLLSMHGYDIIIVTNQTGIAEGRFTQTEYDRINERLLQLLAPSCIKVLKICTCPHSRADDCACRKPKPKMVIDAAAEFGIDLSNTYMVGDRKDDIELAKNAYMKSIFVKTGPFPVKDNDVTAKVETLLDAVRYIIPSSQ
jgi:histidinol-phosphate phosphatase family protein